MATKDVKEAVIEITEVKKVLETTKACWNCFGSTCQDTNHQIMENTEYEPVTSSQKEEMDNIIKISEGKQSKKNKIKLPARHLKPESSEAIKQKLSIAELEIAEKIQNGSKLDKERAMEILELMKNNQTKVKLSTQENINSDIIKKEN